MVPRLFPTYRESETLGMMPRNLFFSPKLINMKSADLCLSSNLIWLVKCFCSSPGKPTASSPVPYSRYVRMLHLCAHICPCADLSLSSPIPQYFQLITWFFFLTLLQTRKRRSRVSFSVCPRI